ncbi:disease resistance protein RUN1-like [Helianthus annuus]|uniref:disease resistance protein RUN1-like n=1 Tax=Helianthus annuus TaxID=4232 RepID=UPI000B905932|nr:disease resistance protein RUN1-like [Helianthus annuus]
MASSSTSFIHKRFTYDVFLSFSGDDTRKTFVDHLYFALQQKRIRTFKDDDDIKIGKNIKDELSKSIEDSKFHVIVFSRNYASSSWCLDELAKIMECHRTKHGHVVCPIFYDVEPSEVRNLCGAVGEAFVKHKEVSIEKWKGALKEIVDLKGWELKNTCDGKFLHRMSYLFFHCNYGI